MIDGALCAILAREHVLLLGPPGTAKSALVRAIARAFKVSYFEALVTRFTTPDEICGPVSLASLEQDRYMRVTAGKLPEAQFAFLDEIWKSSSALLNTLLTIANERLYFNDGQLVGCPLVTLFGASNQLPDGKDLEALFDGADEITDLELGADLGRVLPSELARLRVPGLRLALLRDLAERRCLQYQLTANQALGLGPLVVALDKSSSMEGPADEWATAVALALLGIAQAERRTFGLVTFNGDVNFSAVVRPCSEDECVDSRAGARIPERCDIGGVPLDEHGPRKAFGTGHRQVLEGGRRTETRLRFRQRSRPTDRRFRHLACGRWDLAALVVHPRHQGRRQQTPVPPLGRARPQRGERPFRSEGDRDASWTRPTGRRAERRSVRRELWRTARRIAGSVRLARRIGLADGVWHMGQSRRAGVDRR